MLITVSFVMMVLGVFCLFNKDLAWALYEWDSRVIGEQTPMRGTNWRANVTYASFALVLLGMIGLNLALKTIL